MGTPAVAAIIRRREEDVRQVFHRAGALQALDARSLADLGLEENRILRLLMARSVVRESEPGLYYFDEEVWQSLRQRRRRMVIILIVVVALMAIIGLYGVSISR